MSDVDLDNLETRLGSFAGQNITPQLLRELRSDHAGENHHQNEAHQRTDGALHAGEKLWFKLIDSGSRSAVIAAKLC